MNYIGSKYSLIDFITETISMVTGYRAGENFVFADLFAGTGIVGATYRELGCHVIANDLQYYSYILNRHLIENCPPIDTSLLDELNHLEGMEGFIYNNFCSGSGSNRNYFSDENGKKCDAIRTTLENKFHSAQISEAEYIYGLASLIDSVDRYANTASVYGAFLKKLKKTAQRELILEPLPIIDAPKGIVYNEDSNQLIQKIAGDVLYLDPPYNFRQYCANYHVLETIARYDNPTLKGKTGQRDNSKQKSAFCSRTAVLSAFDDLIKNAQFKYIFLSYNNEGLMPLSAIKRIMSQYGSYSFYTKDDYKRFKADNDRNRRISSHTTTEYLHCLIK